MAPECYKRSVLTKDVVPWCMSFVCLFFSVAHTPPTLRNAVAQTLIRGLSLNGHGFNVVPFFLQVVFIVVFIGVLTHEMISMTSLMFFFIFQSNLKKTLEGLILRWMNF